MPQSQVSYVCSERLSRIEVDACWPRQHMSRPGPFATARHRRLLGTRSFCEHLPLQISSIWNCIEEVKPERGGSPPHVLPRVNIRPIRQQSYGIDHGTSSRIRDDSWTFAMIRPTFPIFFLVKYSAIFSLVQVPASLPHKSPQISIVLPRPRWRVKVFHGPYEASGASRLQTVPICASCWVKWVKWVKGSESAESAEPICTACQVSKPGPGPHTISYFFSLVEQQQRAMIGSAWRLQESSRCVFA
jgi:hypothetical protein